MAGAKEIKQKIKSISNTKKITKAMEMVAVSKMRKASERMSSGKSYAKKIVQVINHLAKAKIDYEHPFLITRDVKKVGIIVVSSDRGLCGGLNNNLFRSIVEKITEFDERGIQFCFSTIGIKAINFFSRLNGEVAASSSRLGDKPQLADIIGPVDVMLNLFYKGEIDAIYLAHNNFINTMTLEPVIDVVVPVDAKEDEYVTSENWDYIYEPDAKSLLDKLLNRYIETLVYQGVVENLACEQAARMVAMKSASDNASDLIDGLQLAYNKARQAAITQELSEIVAGAAAV